MKIRKWFRLTRSLSVLGFLVCIHSALAYGCAYAPDIENPGAPPWVDLWPMRFHVSELDMPQVRTIYVDKDKVVTFKMERYGRRMWWEGFYNAAAQWRFVLYSPEGNIIPCVNGNTWLDSNQASVDCEIDKLMNYLNMPLSADIDFRLRGDESQDQSAPYRSVGRVVFLMKGYEYKYEEPK